MHILGISETWLNDKKTLNVPGYNLIRNDRGLINIDSGRDTLGGGVAFFIHEQLSTSIVAKSKIQSIGQVEYLIILVRQKFEKKSLLLACVYRPPNGLSYSKVFDLIARNSKLASDCIILGDFNGHLETNCPDSREIKDFVKSASRRYWLYISSDCK